MVLEVNGTVSCYREFRPPGSSFSSPTSLLLPGLLGPGWVWPARSERVWGGVANGDAVWTP